jgi:hypothetical protein
LRREIDTVDGPLEVEDSSGSQHVEAERVAAAAALVSGLAGVGDARAHRNVQPAPARPPDDVGRPALVHIILDEHLGIEGFPDADPKARAVRRQLKTFYTSHGFRLFGRAYSEQLRTTNAIPQIVNFGAVQPQSPKGKKGRVLDRNAWFDLLGKEGYRLTVYQSDYIDYCGNPAVARCVRYTFSKMGAAANAAMSLGDRISVILVRFALLADAAQNFRALYIPLFRNLEARGYHPPGVALVSMGRTSSLNAAEAFDTLISDLRHARPGEAYFAHILLPHDPYALAPDCAPKPLRQWQLHDPGSPIAERRSAYFDQVQCVLRKVSAAYAALSDSPAGQRFLMIVHGDHGSRITKVNPTIETVGKFDEDDLVAGYSTLFAIHAPGIRAGYDPQPIAVPELLKGLAASRFTTVPRAGRRHEIILNDRSWAPKRRAPFLSSW